MISFLEGKIEHVGDKYVILNAGGIGYRVHIVPKLLSSLSKKTNTVNRGKMKLFVHSQLNMRDGTFDMYGFDTREGMDLFHLITSVSGIGPKSALNILSTVEVKHLKAAVVNEDSDYLRKVSSLGPKIAKRLVLELKNKVDHLDIGDMSDIDLGQEGQAMDALVALGYSQNQAKTALKEIKSNKLEDRVRDALKLLGKK